MIPLRIVYLFLLEYGKNHLGKAIFSLLGIALGVALFITTTFNGRRAEKALIDFSLGYFGDKYTIRIYHNNGTIGVRDEIVERIYFQKEFRWIRKIYPRIRKTFLWKKDGQSYQIYYQALDFFKERNQFGPFDREKDPNEQSPFKTYISSGLKNLGFSNQENLEYRNQKYTFENTKVLESEGGLFILEDILIARERISRELNYSYLLLETENYTESDLENLRNVLQSIDPGLDLETKEDIITRSTNALKSFHLNLIIISMISVIIAFFMVSNTMTGIFLSRKKELGILRCIGLTPGQNLILFLSQALFLGFFGTVLGLLFSKIFSRFSFFTGESTVNDWNQSLSYTQIPADLILIGVSIGILGSVISAIIPAVRSSKISPLSIVKEILESSLTINPFWMFGIGFVMIVLSFPISKIVIPSPIPIFGLFAIGILIFGQTLLFPILFKGLVFFTRILISKLDKSLVAFRIAIEELFQNGWKNTLTAATLMLAVSLVISLSMLTGSYKESIINWTDREFPYPDSIVNQKDIDEGTANGIPLYLYEEVKKLPNIAEVDVFYLNTRVEVGKKIFTIHGYDFQLAIEREKSRGENTYPEMKPNSVLVSANMAYLNKLEIGQILKIPTKIGEVEFEIAGIREHFFSENGTIMMDYSIYEKYFQPQEYRALRIMYKEPGLRNETLAMVQRLILSHSDLKILSSEELKEIYIRGTEKVFKVLDSLKYTACIIAFISLFSSILYGLSDKLRIFAMIRSLGGNLNQISLLILSEIFFLCLTGISMGILLAFFSGPIILDVINKNAFGWSLKIVHPYPIIWGFLLSSPILTLIGSLFPIWIMKNLSLRQVLSYE